MTVLLQVCGSYSFDCCIASALHLVGSIVGDGKWVKASVRALRGLPCRFHISRERPRALRCREDVQANKKAAELIRGKGFEPIDAGELRAAPAHGAGRAFVGELGLPELLTSVGSDPSEHGIGHLS